jgi:hypothetical protein
MIFKRQFPLLKKFVIPIMLTLQRKQTNTNSHLPVIPSWDQSLPVF